MGKRKLMKVAELGEYLASSIDTENVLAELFPNCDFFIVDADSTMQYSDDEMDYLETTACGWYGIKNTDTGFDSDCLVLIVDYYGGSCMTFTQLYDGIGQKDAIRSIVGAIIESMNVQECGVTKDTVLYCEFS